MSQRANMLFESKCRLEMRPGQVPIRGGTATMGSGFLEGVLRIRPSELTPDSEFNDVSIEFIAEGGAVWLYTATIHAGFLLPFGLVVELVDDRELLLARERIAHDGFATGLTLDDRQDHEIATDDGDRIAFRGKYVSCSAVLLPLNSRVIRVVGKIGIEHQRATSPRGLLVRYEFPMDRFLWLRASHMLGGEPLIQDLPFVDIQPAHEVDLFDLRPSPVQIAIA